MARIDKMLEFMQKAEVSCLDIACADGVCKYRGDGIKRPLEGQISEHQIRELLAEIIPPEHAEAFAQNRPVQFDIISNGTSMQISASQVDGSMTMQIQLPKSSGLESTDLQPSTDPLPITSPSDKQEFRPSVDVSLFGTLVVGLLLTVVIFVACWPIHNSFLGKQIYNLFYDEKGELLYSKSIATAWVPPAEVFLACWSGCILLLKRRKHKFQAAVLKQQIIPATPRDITPENVDVFIANLRQLPKAARHTFLASRILRAFYHFRARKDRSEVATLLASQSEIDALTVTSSYVMLRVFIWALPILGFIGTVIGVAFAVDQFSGLSSPDRLQIVLNGVTTSLAGAFGTTLVALVLSLLVMIPTSALQKSEQDLLNSIDEYCNDSFLRRLHETTTQAMASEIENAGKQLALNMVQQLQKVSPAIGERIAKQFLNAAIPSVTKTVEQLHDASDKLAQSLNEASKQWESLSQKTTAMVNSFERVSSSVSGLTEALKHEAGKIVAHCDSAEGSIKSTMNKVSERADRITQTIAAAAEDLQKSEHALHQAVRSQQEAVKQFETHNDIRIVQKMLTRILNTDRTITGNGQESDGQNNVQKTVAT